MSDKHESLINRLSTMKAVTGLCRTEKETLDEAIEEIIGGICQAPTRDRLLIKWMLAKQYEEHTDVEAIYKKWKEFMEEEDDE